MKTIPMAGSAAIPIRETAPTGTNRCAFKKSAPLLTLLMNKASLLRGQRLQMRETHIAKDRKTDATPKPTAPPRQHSSPELTAISPPPTDHAQPHPSIAPMLNSSRATYSTPL